MASKDKSAKPAKVKKAKRWGVQSAGPGSVVAGGDIDRSVNRTVIHGDVFTGGDGVHRDAQGRRIEFS